MEKGKSKKTNTWEMWGKVVQMTKLTGRLE